MYDTSGPQAETTAEQRKPPTLADIVREKTDDGRLIIDFFLDVMEARVEGAELCHRIDAARQLVKYGSRDAARFIARYRGVPCGHSTRGRPGPADPCSGAEGSPAAEPLNAPGSFTQDFLTVLSAVDEDLMARLVRAQTADGFTVIEFLDDVMQDRNEGFKPYHRIAAAKELIVHIVRDEAPEPVPGEAPSSAHPEPNSSPSFPRRREPIPCPANPEPVLSTVEGPGSVHPEPGSPELSRRVEGLAPNSTVVPAAGSVVVPAEAEPAPYPIRGTQRSGEGRRSHPSLVHPEPGSPELSRRVEGPVLSTIEGPQLETSNPLSPRN